MCLWRLRICHYSTHFNLAIGWNGTGLCNGLSILFGGVGSCLIPESIVAATGSFDAGILSIVVRALDSINCAVADGSIVRRWDG